MALAVGPWAYELPALAGLNIGGSGPQCQS
jgi:hypothetical protein